MHRAFLFTVIFAGFLSATIAATADAEEASAVAGEEQQPESSETTTRSLMSESPDDPGALLMQIEQNRAQKNSVFAVAPSRPLHDTADKWAINIEESTGLQLGAAFNHAFMWLSESPLGDDEYGVASELSVLGTWKLANVGEPNQGQLFFQLQGRWQYGPPGPEVLGTENLGSLIGTANTFSEYVPTFLLRNLYWQQGSAEAGWMFRVGKITTDATLSTSAHIASPVTFLPTAGTGPFANALTDSGLGVAATWFVNDRFKMLGIISDANADRTGFGDITAGDLYTAVEFAYKIAPRTEKAGYTKLTLWHTDATKNGQAVNGHLGPEGHGFFIKHEQELTDDGRAVVVIRYGRSYNESAVYEEQIGAHFLLYNPTKSGLQNDLIGVAVNWAQANVSGARLESNFEIFYRFPIFPRLDVTLSYQSLINLALDPDNDHASAYALRLRTTF